jgi:hypothetical protein
MFPRAVKTFHVFSALVLHQVADGSQIDVPPKLPYECPPSADANQNRIVESSLANQICPVTPHFTEY